MSVNVKFTGDAKSLEAAQKKALAAIEKFEKKSGDALNKLTGNLLKGRGAMVALAGSATLLKGAVAAAVDFEKLKLGLKAVADESENVEEHIARLKELAKRPGLGFEQALKGSVKLQGVGFRIQETEEILKQFGNAVALSANGAPELERITTQLGQLAAKGKILTQDLRPVIEAAPVVSRALKQAFGTVNADDIGKQVSGSQEFIERLLVAMQDLPRAPKSAAESFQNLQDSAKAALAEVGEPIVKELLPALDGLVKLLDENETLLQNFGKSLAFAVTTVGKLSPILGALAVAYLAIKTAQGAGDLKDKIKSQIAATKLSIAAALKETEVIKANTAAQKANAAARGSKKYEVGFVRKVPLRDIPQRLIGNFKGADVLSEKDVALLEKRHAFVEKLREKSGKRGGSKYAKAFLKSSGAALKTQGGALGVSAAGAIATSMLPESKLLGGKAGSTMLDGIGGALALAGPAGIVASLGIQVVKAGYTLGQYLGEAMFGGLTDVEKVSMDALFTEDFYKAVDVGNRAEALGELTKQREKYIQKAKDGDGDVRAVAELQIQNLDVMAESLDGLIQKQKEFNKIEAEAAAYRGSQNVEDRSDITGSLEKELQLLAAKAAGNKNIVAELEKEARIAEVIKKLAKDTKVIASERHALAANIVRLQDAAKAKQKEQNELAKKGLEIEKAKEKAREKFLSSYESARTAYIETLSISKQLEVLDKQRANLLKKGGGESANDVFKKASQARKSGKVEEAERLFSIGKKLLEMEKKREQLEATKKTDAEEKQNSADTQKEFQLQNELLELKLKGDETAVASKEREIALLNETKSIEQELNVSRAVALGLAKKRLDIQEKIKEDEKQKKIKQNRGDLATELRALELEASGRKAAADALREKAAILARAKDLQTQLNVTAAKALELARKENEYKKQIEKSSNNSNKTSTGRHRGIKRDTSGFGARNDDFGVRNRNFGKPRGNLTSRILKDAQRDKASKSSKTDPSLAYLEQINEGNKEMVKIWQRIGAV